MKRIFFLIAVFLSLMFFKARPCVCVSVWVTDIGTCAWFKEQGLRVCVHMVPAGCLGAFRGAPPLKTAPFRTSLPVPTLDLTEGGCPSLQNEKRGKKTQVYPELQYTVCQGALPTHSVKQHTLVAKRNTACSP